MTWKHWTVLGLFALGFAWSPGWILCVLWMELGVRRGREVAALWLESRINRRFRGGE